ncbi:MAG: sulfatase [Planctomycetaceae bacterium]|jgi:arylsulfatase A-like enzyme|nr:sulfatase [Planctomycetaceae bacterium]
MKLFDQLQFVVVLFFMVGFSSVLFGETKTDPRPNILFIFSDDHASHAIGAYGSNRNETPNMDRLAQEGMRFTNCCVTNSICGPSRAVLQTGKYSHVNGYLTHSSQFNIDQPTFPKMFQKAGYQTAVVGKWHLGQTVKGYDYSEILIGLGIYYNPPMIRNGKRVEHTGYVTELITDLSLEWLKNRDKSKPFLLMTQHRAPHREWEPLPKYYEKYKDREFPYPETFDDDYRNRSRAALEQDMTIAETLNDKDLKLAPPDGWEKFTEQQKNEWHKMFDIRKTEFNTVKNDPIALKRWKYQCFMKDYMSCVAGVDDNIGRMLKFLEDNNLAENTIVIYTSDQGFYLGEHGWFDKRFMYEQSFKMPLIVRWQNRVQPGSVNNDIVSNIDFAETLLDMAGIPVPDEMQGHSLIPLLDGKTPQDWRKSFYYHYYEYPTTHMVKKHEGVYDGRFKLIHFYDDIDEWELFDLKNDSNELRNIYSDKQYNNEVVRLQQELERLKTELKVPPVEVNTKSVIFDAEESKRITPPILQRLGLAEQMQKIVKQREQILKH